MKEMATLKVLWKCRFRGAILIFQHLWTQLATLSPWEFLRKQCYFFIFSRTWHSLQECERGLYPHFLNPICFLLINCSFRSEKRRISSEINFRICLEHWGLFEVVPSFSVRRILELFMKTFPEVRIWLKQVRKGHPSSSPRGINNSKFWNSHCETVLNWLTKFINLPRNHIATCQNACHAGLPYRTFPKMTVVLLCSFQINESRMATLKLARCKEELEYSKHAHFCTQSPKKTPAEFRLHQVRFPLVFFSVCKMWSQFLHNLSRTRDYKRNCNGKSILRAF